jgi:peptidoglycan/LPS O-acetylase OafA/YrhL
LIWLGGISYGVYLFHLPVLALLLEATAGAAFDVAKVAPSLRLALCAGPTIALAALSYRYFEAPLRLALSGGQGTADTIPNERPRAGGT